MSAVFNHTIIAAKDRARSAEFYRDLLEASEAPSWGPFTNLTLDGGVLLQFAEPPVDIQMQHYAFLVTEDHFDRAVARLQATGTDYFADPQLKRPGRDQHRARRPRRLRHRPRRPRPRAAHPALPLATDHRRLPPFAPRWSILLGGDGGGGDERRRGEAAPEGGRAVGGESGDDRRGDGEAEARGELEAGEGASQDMGAGRGR